MLPDPLTLFLELAALPSPPGQERAVADRVLAYLRELGLEVSEDGAGPAVGSTIGNLYCRLEPTAPGRPAVSLRPPRHRAAERAARAGGRGRLGAKRGRHDPRRRQQGGRRLDARGRPPRPRGGPAARGDRARVHAEGGGGPPRRRRVRRIQARGAGRLRLRPAGPGRRDRARRADAAVARRDVPRPCGARGDGAGGRALRDRRRRPRDRRPPARAARRGDLGQRRPDLGRDGAQHRAGVVHVPGGGARPRRAAARRRRRRDARDDRLRRERGRLRGRDDRAGELPRLSLPPRRPRRAARRGRAASARGTRRATR